MRRVPLLAALALLSAACDRGPSISAYEFFPDSSAAALAEAAAEGDTARIRSLIAAGADPNARGRDQTTVAQWALLNQSALGLAALLTGGADPASPTPVGRPWCTMRR
jgi:ankyrin repeat protein